MTSRPQVPEAVAALLLRAHAEEGTAAGAQRRPAFRLTRVLLGGAYEAGFSPSLLAGCLGVTPDAIRTRCVADGWVSREDAARIAGIDAETLDAWEAQGRLPTGGVGGAILASELVSALVMG